MELLSPILTWGSRSEAADACRPSLACRNKRSSSSCRWCITAFITRLPGTWWTTAFRSLMWPVDDIFVLPVVITSLCLDTVSARMVVGHLLLPARLTVWNSLSDDLRDPSLRQRRSVLYRRRTISVITKKRLTITLNNIMQFNLFCLNASTILYTEWASFLT